MTTLPGRLLTLEALQDLGLSPSTVTRAVRRGDLLRIRQGVYATPSWWRDLGAEGRLRQMHAALALRAASAPVFGHSSAALLHGLDLLHRPAAPHVVSPPGRGSRNNRTCVHHWAELPPEHVVRVGGLLATSVPRTVLDCASTLPLREAVVTADHALRRGTERAELLALLERRAGAPGCRRARRVLDLADGRSESPGETLTRLVLLRARLPRPELQVRIRTPRGLYRGDFGWRILRTDWATVVHRPDDLVALVRRELAARDRRIIE